MPRHTQHPAGGWRARLYDVIFESEDFDGKVFDVVLIVAIALSVAAVMLESVASVRARYLTELRTAEWFFTILFTIEYVLRLVCVRHPRHYAFSFFGIVDLLAIIPTYVSVLIPGAQYLLVVRLLRILRVFRVLKLIHYLNEADVLVTALRESRRKITVFIFAVLTLDVILGSLMYLVEGPENGFRNIPVAIYWTIVTLTTVGYGDISPQTPLGQSLASLIMIIGYGIIAVPTGIVTVELSRAGERLRVKAPEDALDAIGPGAAAPAAPEASAGASTPDSAPRESPNRKGVVCPRCGEEGHDPDARFCKRCGEALDAQHERPHREPAEAIPSRRSR